VKKNEDEKEKERKKRNKIVKYYLPIIVVLPPREQIQFYDFYIITFMYVYMCIYIYIFMYVHALRIESSFCGKKRFYAFTNNIFFQFNYIIN